MVDFSERSKKTMSRPSKKLVWFGGQPPTPADTSNGAATTNTTTTSSASSLPTRQPQPPRKNPEPEPRRLAVVLEDLPTYRRYKRGSGPPLRPITLAPPRDSTAYIRDEFFVPPALSDDGKKRLQYVVGWTDLPAARVVIDAEQICDYVSPMAYEEWCSARAEERDEEERRLEEAENVRAVEEAVARERGVAMPGEKGGKGAKRGRKRKHVAAEELRTPPPATAADGVKKKRGRPRKNAPSLSTPSKSALVDDFKELDTEGDADVEMEEVADDEADDEAIFRQLNGTGTTTPLILTEDSYDSGEQSSLPAGLEPPSKKQRTRSPRPAFSRFMPGIETDTSSRSTPFDSSRGATSSPALPPLPQPPAPGLQGSSGRPRETPIFPPIPPASANHTSTPTAPRVAKTQQPPKRSLLSIRDPPSTPQQSSSPKVQTPTPKASSMLPPPATAPPALNPTQNGTGTNTGWNHTPIPKPGSTPLISNTTPWTISLAASKSSSSYSQLTPSQPVQSIEQPISTTPIPLPKIPGPKPHIAPTLREPQQAALPQTASAPPATTTGSKTAATNSKPTTTKLHTARKTGTAAASTATQDDDEEEDEDEQVYEVLRIEGFEDRVSRRSGKKLGRFFQVRWKGNWPSSMNPTWEPESNIPQHVIQRFYFRKGTTPKRNVQAGAMDKYLVPKKYSSVSRAVEGEDELVRGHGDHSNGNGNGVPAAAKAALATEAGDENAMDQIKVEGDDDEGNDMMLVTDFRNLLDPERRF
ncbi:chromo domain-containing protein [Colletotrichum lupini]|uniref:Chromo domain-containing protein n=1 Tax=Colletotrichum lupini TaxID=145971 RepID=A0A9Q8SZY9_9PEZI|nr:chromo domain-containing protein [Colletotrichum lupini]UQC86245.1 chromo domain-containing protein [Colletotrichum lupini]